MRPPGLEVGHVRGGDLLTAADVQLTKLPQETQGIQRISLYYVACDHHGRGEGGGGKGEGGRGDLGVMQLTSNCSRVHRSENNISIRGTGERISKQTSECRGTPRSIFTESGEYFSPC